MARMTQAEALAQAGAGVSVMPAVQVPGINPEKADIDFQTFYRDVVRQAFGIPGVAEASFKPPVAFFDDFLAGGYTADLALASESDPAAKFSCVADAGEWLVSLTGANTLVVADNGPGGWLAAVTAATLNSQSNIQLNGESFKLVAGAPLYFEARVMIQDISDTDAFVGLSIPNTDITASVGASDDAVGFHIELGQIVYISSADGTDSTADTTLEFADSAITDINTKSKRLGFYWDGVATLTFYVDGVNVKALVVGTDNINQDEAMSPIFAVDSVVGNTAETLWVDYIYCVQLRP